MTQPILAASWRSLFASGVLALALAPATLAGTGSAITTPPAASPATASPLGFYDGAVVLDLEERARFEIRNNNRDFDDAINDDNDDSWLINRFRLGVSLQPASWLRFYAQGQDTREWDSDRPNIPGVRGNEGGDDFDLRQAYVEIGDRKLFPLTAIVGRQRLNYGEGRLVADPRWNNAGRTFDAVKLRFEVKQLWAEAFASRPVQIKERVFNDSDAADNFFGLYLSTEALRFQSTDLYVFFQDKQDNQPDLISGAIFDARGVSNGPAQRVTTIGTRWKSTPATGPWDYTLEAAFQFGDVWVTDRNSPRLEHRAFAGHFSGGYTFEHATWRPRLGVGYNFATGDQDPTDDRNQSFQTFFPSNHSRFGDMDEYAWRNLHDLRFQLTARPTKLVEVEIAYTANWLADTSDYWYRGQNPLRTRTPSGQDVRTVGAGNFAGHEIDVAVRWSPVKWLNLDTGYAHLFAGDYLRATGPSDDAEFGYLQAQVLF